MKFFQLLLVPSLANFADFKACVQSYGVELHECVENILEYPICNEQDPNYRPLGIG